MYSNKKIKCKHFIRNYKIYYIYILTIYIIFIYKTNIFCDKTKKTFLKIVSESYSNFNISELKDDKERKLFTKNLTEFYIYARTKYLMEHKVNYNESNLITFQDKLNYLVIHESPQYKSFIVDKIRLSDYSKKILGKNICVPIIKIYDNIEDINFKDLPNKFVMKYNHGSGMNIICQDKKKFDLHKAKKKLYKWKNINYGLFTTEFQYMYVKRKIYIEKFLQKSVIDYKVYCFNGNPKFILAKIPLKKKKLKNYYDLEWKYIKIDKHQKNLTQLHKFIKPNNLKLMLRYSKLLSQEFVFVRVDLYEINNQVFLGELTFTPMNSFKNWKDKNTSIRIGNLIDIKRIKKYLFNT